MKQTNEDAKESLYNLTEISPKKNLQQQQTSLISMLNQQVQLLKKTVTYLNNTLQLYHTTVNHLAELADIQVFKGEVKDGDLSQLQKWFQVMTEKVEEKLKETPEVVQKIVQVERVVEVETPIFIERIKQVDRPITVVQEVERVVEKPIYIQREVQVPIFVEKKSNALCKNCSAICG